jgi:predicted ATP-binding protein involved in virulence
LLKSIKIKKLFDIFDYDITLKDSGITILTGPNGSGKTTILRIIHALASHNVLFFISLEFKKIEFHFKNNTPTITIVKNDKNTITISKGNLSESVSKQEIYKTIKDKTEYRLIDDEGKGTWVDRYNEAYISTNDMFSAITSDESRLKEIVPSKIPQILDQSISAYLIKEQRLLRPRMRDGKRPRYYMNRPEFEPAMFTDSIEEYSKEFAETFRNILAEASQVSQKLDSSFPQRLFAQKTEITEEEFNQRFEKIEEKHKLLAKYEALSIEKNMLTTFKQENAKALQVYIEDSEKKMHTFDDLLKNLEMFTEILNKRRFSHKQIKISKNGFSFETKNNTALPLTSLSSGEQQEIVLLYELLFKTNKRTLVLIDEPEISLHVAWQKAFLNDCVEISKLRELHMIISTHSPQIINENWELTVDLDEISRTNT